MKEFKIRPYYAGKDGSAIYAHMAEVKASLGLAGAHWEEKVLTIGASEWEPYFELEPCKSLMLFVMDDGRFKCVCPRLNTFGQHEEPAEAIRACVESVIREHEKFSHFLTNLRYTIKYEQN